MIPAGAPPLMTPLRVLPPSLCEAGPCKHFHRIASVMDAQEPLSGGGQAHTMVTRACYPVAGIKIDLGEEEPILQCSRWEPDGEAERLNSVQQQFLKSGPGQDFANRLAAHNGGTP